MARGLYDYEATEQLLVGLIELSAYLAERFQDGIDLGDAVALATKLTSDEIFRDHMVKMATAMIKPDSVVKEVKDFTTEETMELAMKMMPKMLELISKIKKQ